MFLGLLTAQNDVVVIHSQGQAFYLAPRQHQEREVYPGMRLDLNGGIRCGEGASVKLLFDGKAFTFHASKSHPLRELAQAAGTGEESGFLSRFWSFMTSDMQQTNDEETLERHHRRYMETVSGGVRGFAQQPYAIRTGRIYGGTLSGPPVTFRWSGTAPQPACRFLLTRQSDERPVVSALVRDSSFSLDLSQLDLEIGVAYCWQLLSLAEGTPALSAKTIFYYDSYAAEKVLKALLTQHEYHHVTPVEQLLMQAYALEEAGLWYDADEKYATAAATYSNNKLVRDARAAFLSRMDLWAEARNLLKDDDEK